MNNVPNNFNLSGSDILDFKSLKPFTTYADVLQKCVTALEKTWHTEHFFCAQCGKQFGEEGFHERDGKPYCRDDYFDMFAPKCAGCNRPIMENYVSALSAQWHSDCFVCRVRTKYNIITMLQKCCG